MPICRLAHLLPSVAICASLMPVVVYGQGGDIAGTEVIHATATGVGETLNAPYSGYLVTTSIKTLADGTKITHVTKAFTARDSQGRTRIEHTLASLRGTPDQDEKAPIFIWILDPQAKQSISLDTRQKTATITRLPGIRLPDIDAAGHQRSSASGIGSGTAELHNPGIAAPRVRQEKLPGQTIDGVYAEGTRITKVIAAGTVGNDRDITVVNETWRSPELKIDVLRKIIDPRSGETTIEIQDLSRAEPSAELFQVPADYAVKNPRQE
jgi:hypothetical protein